MKIGMLGTGLVGMNLATKLVQTGHEVKIGARTKGKKEAVDWVNKNGPKASEGTFADAAAFGDIIFNCTNGQHSLDALKLAGENNMNGKVLVDVANPLDFSTGELRLTVCNTDSLGEQIQRAFPNARVVKSLNTMGSDVQVNPSLLPGDHDVFLCGNDQKAKDQVTEILRSFGWKSIIDTGDIKSARGMEALLLFWISLMKKFPNEYFNYKIVRKTR
jgi:predicted dinucleotide-binding enzyme